MLPIYHASNVLHIPNLAPVKSRVILPFCSGGALGALVHRVVEQLHVSLLLLVLDHFRVVEFQGKFDACVYLMLCIGALQDDQVGIEH